MNMKVEKRHTIIGIFKTSFSKSLKLFARLEYLSFENISVYKNVLKHDHNCDTKRITSPGQYFFLVVIACCILVIALYSV